MENAHRIIDFGLDKVPASLFKDEALMERFLGCVPSAYTEDRAYVSTAASGAKQIVVEKPAGRGNMNIVDGEYTVEGIIDAMDEAGVDVAVLRVPVWQEWMPLDLCRLFNDDFAAFAAQAPDRFKAMASIPPWGDRASLDELKRCMDDLGFVGVQLSCHYGTKYLDDPAFRPLLRVLDERRIPAAIRAVPLPVDYRSIVAYDNVRRELGRSIDTLTGLSLELYSGIFEEFPNLRFVHGMLGGGWFAFDSLLRPKQANTTAASVKRLDADAARNVGEYLGRNVFFEITHPKSWGKKQIECALDVCGADRFVFGTSIPVFPGAGDVAEIEALDIEAGSKDAILGGNACALLGI